MMMVASGRTLSAVAVMLILATFQILQGIRAVIVGGTFVDGTGFAYRANNTAFGWLHIALGALVAVTAVALVSGRAWARAAATFAVVLTAIAAFFWIAYLPVFALVLIALTVFVIWAAGTGGRQRMMQDMDQEEAMGTGYGGGARTGERWPAENAPSGRDWDAENRQTAREQRAAAQERANAEARGGRPNNPPPSGDNG